MHIRVFLKLWALLAIWPFRKETFHTINLIYLEAMFNSGKTVQYFYEPKRVKKFNLHHI